jgi:RNA recognition motif-containing protein
LIKNFSDASKLILDIRIVMNDEGKSKGYAFVDVVSEDIANFIVEEINSDNSSSKIICAITKSFDENDERTIFINNLPYNTNEAEIKSIFSKFGTVIDVRLKRENSNNANSKIKGYGFVEFSKPDIIDNLLKCNEVIIIKGRQVVLKPSKSYNKIKQGIKHVVHISNLDYSIQESDLEEFFRKNDCFMIIEIKLLKTISGESKGIALVEFSTEEMLIKAIHLSGSQINSRPITIKKALSNKIGENLIKEEVKSNKTADNLLSESKGKLNNKDFKKMLFEINK